MQTFSKCWNSYGPLSSMFWGFTVVSSCHVHDFLVGSSNSQDHFSCFVAGQHAVQTRTKQRSGNASRQHRWIIIFCYSFLLYLFSIIELLWFLRRCKWCRYKKNYAFFIAPFILLNGINRWSDEWRNKNSRLQLTAFVIFRFGNAVIDFWYIYASYATFELYVWMLLRTTVILYVGF